MQLVTTDLGNYNKSNKHDMKENFIEMHIKGCRNKLYTKCILSFVFILKSVH